MQVGGTARYSVWCLKTSRAATHLDFLRVVHILQSELILIVQSKLVDLVLELYHQSVLVLQIAPCHQNLLGNPHKNTTYEEVVDGRRIKMESLQSWHDL